VGSNVLGGDHFSGRVSMHKGKEVVIIRSIRKSENTGRRTDKTGANPRIEREIHRPPGMR
jgi:hypothetical protein